jgi:purine nucleoside phosphorylase
MNAGPHYETMAECIFEAKLGGDALGNFILNLINFKNNYFKGMSTCHEIMVARQLGIRCFAFSLITNCNSLDLDNSINVSHSDVLKIGEKFGEKISKWIEKLIKNLDDNEENKEEEEQ